jgi:hypothetical protein
LREWILRFFQSFLDFTWSPLVFWSFYVSRKGQPTNRSPSECIVALLSRHVHFDVFYFRTPLYFTFLFS